MTVILTATSGLLWGALAHLLEAARPLPPALVAGACVGMIMGFVIKPFRDVEWPATAMLSLVGLYVAVVLFAAVFSAARTLMAGGSPATLPVVAGNLMWAYFVGLTGSGFVFMLWPLSFANHLLVWWCHRRREVAAS
jgi:hypothetical protein